MTQTIYNADFSTIKSSIIDFFENDTTFNSYNFEGSAITNVIDVLSYIEQNATFYLNNTANEMFVSSATQQKNIYKNAKKLNYFPLRKSAGSIKVTFSTYHIDMVIPVYSQFSLGNLNMVLFENVTLNAANSWTATANVYEGELLTETSVVNTTELYTMTVDTTYTSVDNTHVYVYVDEPDGFGGFTLSTTPWTNSDEEIIETNTDSYFTTFTNSTFSIKFDNGRIFNIPAIDDQVRIIYLKTTGTESNGTTGTIETTITNLSVNVGSNIVSNGLNEETDAEIQLRAPLYYSSQGRGVTEQDWNVILQRYPNSSSLKDATIWGGDKENVSAVLGDNIVESPDTYQNLGRVIVTAINSYYTFLSTPEQTLLFTFLENYKIAGLKLRFLQSNIYRVAVTVSIKTNSSLTFSQSDFENTINSYLTNLEGFEKDFYKSKLTKLIDEQGSIVYSDVSFTTSIQAKNESYKTIRIGSAVTPGSVYGLVSGQPLVDNGAGIIRYGTIPVDVGTINYTTGFITLTSQISILPVYEFNFQLASDLSASAIRESIFNFSNIVLINL